MVVAKMDDEKQEKWFRGVLVLLEILALVLLLGFTVFAVYGFFAHKQFFSSWNSAEARLDYVKLEDALSQSADALNLGLERVDSKVQLLEGEKVLINRFLSSMVRYMRLLTEYVVQGKESQLRMMSSLASFHAVGTKSKSAHGQPVFVSLNSIICEIFNLKEQACSDLIGRSRVIEKKLAKLHDVSNNQRRVIGHFRIIEKKLPELEKPHKVSTNQTEVIRPFRMFMPELTIPLNASTTQIKVIRPFRMLLLDLAKPHNVSTNQTEEESELSKLFKTNLPAHTSEEPLNVSTKQTGEFVVPPLPKFPIRVRRAVNHDPEPRGISLLEDYWYHHSKDPTAACRVPNKGLKTAEILCKVWSTTMRCNMYCVYGSTFPEGINRTLNCTHGFNQWSRYFEECQPFVNCKLQLNRPGSLKCIDHKVTEKPICQISCDGYEDEEGAAGKSYECDTNGTWSPPLPVCVSRKEIPLVNRPKIVEHTKLEYPKTQEG